MKRRKTFLEKALILEPENVGALIHLGDIDLRLGDLEQARAQYQKTLETCKSPQDRTQAYRALRRFHELNGQLLKSLEYRELELAEMEKFAPPALTLLSRLNLNQYVEAGQTDSAWGILRKIEAQIGEPWDRFLPFGYLDLYLALEDAEKSQEMIQKAESVIQIFQLEVVRPHMLESLGKIHEMRNENAQAVEAYRRQLELAPTDFSIYRRMGRCFRKLEQLEEAEEHLQKALKVFPSDPKSHFELALVYEEMGNRPAAIENLQYCLEVWIDADPEYQPAHRARQKLKEWKASSPDSA